jgi:hypothetical protein
MLQQENVRLKAELLKNTEEAAGGQGGNQSAPHRNQKVRNLAEASH